MQHNREFVRCPLENEMFQIVIIKVVNREGEVRERDIRLGHFDIPARRVNRGAG